MMIRHGSEKVVLLLGEWTLSVYAGREQGTLPAAAPEVVLYKSSYDEKKNKIIAHDRLTPWDRDFGETLKNAIEQFSLK